MKDNHAEMIGLRDIGFSYGTAKVLDAVTLGVREGEFVGVVGPNGSGKTTLLKLISKALKPRRGKIEIAGRDISHIPGRELARAVAVVPQDTNVLFAYTVADIVLMGRSPHLGALSFEREADFSTARAAMETMDVAHLSDRLLSEVSGGEKQRTIIARALAQESRIMLLDEPTAFLDLKHQVGIYEVLRRLNREKNLTILVVSHGMNLAAQFCDRIIMLKDGGVAADGATREVMTKENIERVFETRVSVSYSETTGAPLIVPIAKEQQSSL